MARDGKPESRRYTEALLAELDHRAPLFADGSLATVYVGGGTPSLWPLAELAEVLDAVRGRFSGRPSEVTLEANPSDCTDERMAAWRELGVNRLSIGAQSFQQEDLTILGRDHRMGQGLEAIGRAMKAGFDSISVDLILAVPGACTDPGVAKAIELAVPHLSIYELTVEPKTRLARAVERGQVVLIGEDERAARYQAAHESLAAAGYEHYEISSYAVAGHHSKHNSSYWSGAPYLGLGNGAASLTVLADGGGVRTNNHRSHKRYIAADRGCWADFREELSASDMARDRIWLGLRTSAGVPAEDLSGTPELRDWLLSAELVQGVDGRYRPTLRGYLLCDAIARRVVATLG